MKRNLTDSILRTTKVGGHIEQVLGPTVEGGQPWTREDRGSRGSRSSDATKDSTGRGGPLRGDYGL